MTEKTYQDWLTSLPSAAPATAAQLRSAAATTPDAYAQDVLLARRAGVPPEVAERNRDALKSMVLDDEAEQLMRTAPGLARMLQQSHFAKLAQDQRTELATFEQAMTVARRIVDGNLFGDRFPSFNREVNEEGFREVVRRTRASTGAAMDEQDISRMLQQQGVRVSPKGTAEPYAPTSFLAQASTSFRQGLTSSLRSYDLQNVIESQEILQAAELADKGDVEALAKSKYASLFAGAAGNPEVVKQTRARAEANYAENLLEYIRRTGELKNLPTSRAMAEYQRAEGVGDVLSAFAKNPPQVVTGLLGQSLGALAPTAALMAGGGFAAGVRGLVAGTGASSFATGFVNDITSYFDSKKVDVSNGDAVRKTLSTPEFIEHARQAFVKNSVIGAVDAATAGVAGAVRLAKSPMKNLAAQTGVQMAGGGGGEALGSLLSGQDVSFNAVFSEMIAETPGAAFDIAVLATNGAERARVKAGTTSEYLGELVKQAAANKVLERDTDTFEQFTKSLVDEGATSLYISADALNQSGVLQQLTAASPELMQQIQAAMAANSDVQIPIHEFLGRLTKAGVAQQLVDHVRLPNEQFSKAEAEEYKKTHGPELLAKIEQAITKNGAQIERAADIDFVQKNIAEQIKATGRYTDSAANDMATQDTQFFVTMAGRTGMTVKDFYERFKRIVSDRAVTTADKIQLIQQRKSKAPGVMLNVGLAIPADQGGGMLTTAEVDAALAEIGVTVESGGQAQSNTEMTYIPKLSRALTDAELDALSIKLRQQAIPQLAEGVGSMRGPMADTWGPFDGKQFYLPDGSTLEQRQEREVDVEVETAASLEAARQIAAETKWPTIRDFKVAIQNAVVAAAGKRNLVVDTPENRKYLVRQLLREAKLALQSNPDAIGWYDEKVTIALEIMSEVHPELATDPKARFAFTWALAVTSNGVKVGTNFMLADKAYEAWKASNANVEDRRFPESGIGIGAAGGKIDDALATFNHWVAQWGLDAVKEFATKYQVNRDVKATTGKPVSGEGLDTMVFGAGIVGPKIGNGFFMNLYGEFGQLTMDRWWVRLWGRLTADLVEYDPVKIRASRDAFLGVIDYIKQNPEATRAVEAALGTRLSKTSPAEMAQAIVSRSGKDEFRDVLRGVMPGSEHVERMAGLRGKLTAYISVGDELRKAAKNYLGAMDGQIETPGSSSRRNMMRAVAAEVHAELLKDHPQLTMADFQALMWYPEKRLYESASDERETAEGYEDGEAPDYANAAISLAREKGLNDETINKAVARATAAVQARGRAAASGRGDVGAGTPVAPGENLQQAGDRGGRTQGGATAPLPGTPQVDGATGPDPELVAVAEAYARSIEVPLRRQGVYVEDNPELGRRIAAAYDAMQHAPDDPAVRASYDALIAETRAQYDALVAAGYSFTFYTADTDPYDGNPWAAMRELRSTKSMAVYATYDGYGNDVNKMDTSKNLLLVPTGLQWPDQAGVMRDVTANDLFRAVHDAFGHGLEGAGFRARGEANAFEAHARLYSPAAMMALANETRAQNSWLNHNQRLLREMLGEEKAKALHPDNWETITVGEHNQTAKVGDTIFADQKNGVLPEWVWTEGRAPDASESMWQVDSAAFWEWFGDSKVVDAEGNPLVVYHATTENFDVFKPGGNDPSLSGHAIWFTDSREYQPAAHNIGAMRDGSARAGHNVMPVYLSMRRPLVIDDRTSLEWARSVFANGSQEFPQLLPKAWVDAVRAGGEYDGIIYDAKSLAKDMGWKDSPVNEYIVFESNQIKSVFNKNPTNDPNILRQPSDQPKGQYHIPTRTVSLLDSADLSTFHHEAAHSYLEILAELANQPDAPQDIKDMMSAFLRWRGITGLEDVGKGAGGTTLGQVGSDAFKRWFGDSKVVDAEGKPLVMYHGTYGDFDTFKRRTGDIGLHFGDAATAGDRIAYAVPHRGNKEGKTLSANMMPVYLSIKNPIRMRDHGFWNVENMKGGLLEMFPQDERRIGNRWHQQYGLKSTKDIREYLQSKGYDGVVYKNEGEVAGSEPFRERLAQAREAMDKVFPKGKNSFSLNDQKVPEYIAWSNAQAAYAAHRKNAGTDSYIAFSPTQIKSAIGNRGTYDPNDPNILNQGGDPVAAPSTPPLGRTPLETWNLMTLEEKRPHHEAFARGYEMFLFEGKAPNVEMRTLFQRFREWMIGVYKVTTRAMMEKLPEFAGVKLNDEIRSVYSRLLASDEQIEIAHAASRSGVLFANAGDAAKYGIDPAMYQAEGEDEKQAALDKLQVKSLAEMKWLQNARSRTLRALQREAADARRETRMTVRRELMAQPIYQAWVYLSSTGEESGKLRAVETIEAAGAPVVKQLREYGMIDADGQDPDMIASQFGFDSGAQLATMLADTTPLEQAIREETDRRMLANHSELATPEALARAVDDALHNKHRTKMAAMELNALEKAIGVGRRAATSAKLAIEFARNQVSNILVRNLNPGQAKVAEARAARDSIKAFKKGDINEAVRHKRNEVVNGAIVRAINDAKEEVAKTLAYFKKIDTPAARKKRRGEYLAQRDALLARFDLRQSTSLTKLDAQRTALAEWVQTEAARLSAISPDLPDWILNEGYRKSYKDMSVEELAGLRSAVEQLDKMARRENEQYLAIRNQTFTAERDALLARIRQTYPGAFGADGEPTGVAVDLVPSLAAKFGELEDAFLAEMIGPEHLMLMLDGGTIGPAWESLFGRLSRASDWKAERLGQLFEELKPLLRDQYSLVERRAFGHADIGTPAGLPALTRENAVVITLLNGSAEGRQRLSNYGWGPDTIQKISNLLDERDVKLVNAIWRMFDHDLWPELKALNERTKGTAPKKVVAVPSTIEKQVPERTVDGQVEAARVEVLQLTGGYFPIKYDSDIDERTKRRDDAASLADMMGGDVLGMSAKPRSSASKERVATVSKHPLLELKVLSMVANETVHDIAYREAVADVMRMLNDSKVTNALKIALGIRAYRALVTKVRGVAAPPVEPSSMLDRTLSLARKNTVTTLLSGAMTALQNITGFASSVIKTGPLGLGSEIGKFFNLVQTAERTRFAMEHSAYMRGLTNHYEREVTQAVKNLTVNNRIMPDTGAMLFLMGWMNMAVAVPTWNAAFKDGMEMHANDVSRAVDHADSVVRQTQGGGRKLDLAQVADGGELRKLFTMFGSYFFNQLGLLVQAGAIRKQEAGTEPMMATLRFTTKFFMVFVVAAAANEIIKNGLDGEDEDESQAKRWAKVFASYGAAMFPVVRDVYAFAMSKFDPSSKFHASNFRFSPAEAAFEGVVLGIQKGYELASGEGDIKDVRGVIMAAGFLLGLPGKLIADMVTGTNAWLSGEAGPQAVLFGPPRKPQ